jgi:hypothetical protein
MIIHNTGARIPGVENFPAANIVRDATWRQNEVQSYLTVILFSMIGRESA